MKRKYANPPEIGNEVYFKFMEAIQLEIQLKQPAAKLGLSVTEYIQRFIDSHIANKDQEKINTFSREVREA